MKIEITRTNGIESMPSLETSVIMFLPKTFQRSGSENTRFIKRQYRPKVAIELVITIECNLKIIYKSTNFLAYNRCENAIKVEQWQKTPMPEAKWKTFCAEH
jgi:hypothetical protein